MGRDAEDMTAYDDYIVRIPHQQEMPPCGMVYADVLRFWSYVRRDKSGCLLWIGAISSTGYGTFSIRRRSFNAHRIAYQLVRGSIEQGKHLDHLCRVRACVNPDHLEVVTQRENLLRGFSPAAQHARATHCIHGHEFTPDNIYWRPDHAHQRCCKKCIKIRDATRPKRDYRDERLRRIQSQLAS